MSGTTTLPHTTLQMGVVLLRPALLHLAGQPVRTRTGGWWAGGHGWDDGRAAGWREAGERKLANDEPLLG